MIVHRFRDFAGRKDLVLLAFILIVATAGCARVDVYKVGPGGVCQGPSGVRFNRPRPYVAVHEPFIVGARAYLVKGQVSPDGKFVLITSATDQLDGTLRTIPGGKIESSRVLLSTPPSTSGSAPGGVQAATEPTKEAGGGQPPAPAEKTGQGQLKVTNDNNAFAVQPMRRYFDIVYMEDFEEEFVVQVEQRMGVGSAQVALGQGWSLQGLDARVDNDAITRRLFSLYDESIKIALQLGKAALGIPGVPGGVQAAKEATAAQLPAGTDVTIKVAVVRMVAPGVYPILKPAEGKFLIDNLVMLRQLMPELDRRMLIPVYPMTNVAFNTYETVVLEAAPAAGDSPLRMQQYIDTTGGAPSSKGTQTPVPGAATNLEEPKAREGLEKAIADKLNLKDSAHTYTVTIKAVSKSEGNVSVKKDGGTLTLAEIKAAVEEAAGASGVKLTVTNP